MNSNIVRVTIVALCFFFYAQLANAGFTSIYISPTPGSTIPVPDYNADPVAGSLDVSETWTNDHGTEYSFDVWGTTDSDPPLHIIKEVTNGTGVAWVGYNIDLDPTESPTFEETSPVPSSDVMTLISSSPYSLDFGLPSPVGPGDSVTFDFVVNIPSTGGFSFTLTQSPILIPEPSACVLVFLGTALVAALYRRRV
jgi:hypothetical protein